METQWLSQLKKLHITRLQWRIFLKWALYTAAFLATVVLQTVIFSRLPVLGAKVNLVPYFIGCVCIIEGADSGSVFALITSLVWAMSSGDLGYVSILALTCGGMGLGLLMQKLFRQQLLTCIGLCFALSLCHESAIFLLRLFLDSVTASQYFRILIPGVLLGIPSCPVFYYLFRVIHRVGGSAWNA